MTAQAPVDTSEQRKKTSVPWQDFEVTLLQSLEISSWDLAVLEHHLVAAKWVPSSTEEDAVKEAVFRLRQSYESAVVDYASIFPRNERLTRLFDIWTDMEVEEAEMEDMHRYMDPGEKFKLIVKRETAKYNAVRSLIAHLAARKNPTGPTGSMIHLTNEQATELLNTNACMRAIYLNNVKKLVEHETKNLKQKISEKDAEIAGMLKSLA